MDIPLVYTKAKWEFDQLQSTITGRSLAAVRYISRTWSPYDNLWAVFLLK